ncbi:hypothetical protein TOPH_04808 [Tolypocladium ophioglossoides CBS 100239]|uniref:Uncharacterized protein n=1 Tax=Tolypocladium ophioglossoides (strain CBS 100239) TaxID=1163406 RepID=A0A0L0N941_TOLOC|nr:hypothetical protein TOPH_04808 [Tolypocladium ophioglossoides CBS 100239]
MPRGRPALSLSLTHSLTLSLTLTLTALASSLPSTVARAPPTLLGLQERNSDPLNIDWGPAPDPQDGPSFSAGALRNKAYLPAEIGGIVAAYGVSLVLVAITLLSLAKKRRERLQAGNDELVFGAAADLYSQEYLPEDISSVPGSPKSAVVPNFPYPPPIQTDFSAPGPYIHPSPTSTTKSPGVDPSVDQKVVQADREMAQQQLEEMYKHVMEHEDAKQRGVVLETPIIPGSSQQRAPSLPVSKKERAKPANLNLTGAREEKTLSKASSFFSSLRSPRKKSVKGVSISSPIMTPQSSTFPRHYPQEMDSMTPRLYAAPPPPPIPADQVSFGAYRTNRSSAPLTPDMSPESVQSIDERINAQLGLPGNNRLTSRAPMEADPESATSEHSQVPLVRIPPSSKSGPRSPGLPSSPKPGVTFDRPNPPSAVRAGGNLPLRAYEPAMVSPSTVSHTTRQTVFERKGPLSPTTGRTPRTAGAVPYSPYQPFTPCIPVTPSLVTKEDRRRMKRMVPKTPIVELVQSSEDVW